MRRLDSRTGWRSTLAQLSIRRGAMLPRSRMASALQLAWACGGMAAPVAPAVAQVPSPAARFDIPAGPLDDALRRYAAEAGLRLSADPTLTAGRRSPGLHGSVTAAEGWATLLAGTGLIAARQADDSYRLQSTPDEATLPVVKVRAQLPRYESPLEVHGLVAQSQETATKMALPIRETPQAISVITRESIDLRQARDVSSALELAAGVGTAQGTNGGPFAAFSYDGGDAYSMRGQVLNGKRDVRIDGFAMNSDSNPFDLAAFERVEVVRGPSSMLYGQGSLGGFINLVRKKPQADAQVEAVAQFGSYSTSRVEVDATGALDAQERLLGRGVFVVEDNGSFIAGAESQRTLVAPNFELRIGDGTRALLDLYYQDDRFIPTSGMPLRVVGDGTRVVAPDVPHAFFWGVPSEQKSTGRIEAAMLRVDHSFNDRWLGSLQLQRTRQKHLTILDSYGFGPAQPDGATTLYSGQYRSDSDLWAGELRLDGQFDAFGRKHRVLLGLEKNGRDGGTGGGYRVLGVGNLYDGNFEAIGTFPGQDNPIALASSTYDGNKGAYAQLLLGVAERTKLLVGLRRDWAYQRTRDDIAGAVTDELKANATTYRAGLVHDFSKQVTGYVNYAESFNPVSGQTRAGTLLDPETGKSYELGLKTEWFDKLLAAGIAIYRQELNGSPISDPTNGPSESFVIPGGLQRADGVELELSGSPMRGVTMGAAATWLDAKYIDPRDANFGLTPVGATDRQFALYGKYDFDGALQGYGVGATAIKVGNRSISFGTPRFVDGYERFDLNLYCSGIKNLDLSLQIRNLFNQTYIERYRWEGFGNFYGAPRAYLLRAAYRFL